MFSRTEIVSTGEHYNFTILISCIFHGVLNAKQAKKNDICELIMLFLLWYFYLCAILMCNRCCFLLVYSIFHMGVSKNSGTPKSSILIGISLINHPFWGTTIFGNTLLVLLGAVVFLNKSLGSPRSWTRTTRSPDSRPWPKSPGRLDRFVEK